MMIKRIRKNIGFRLLAALGLTISAIPTGNVWAMPTGGEVKSGEAVITQNGQQLDIDQQTPRVAIDWTSFNIAQGEQVRFNQQSDWIALNRVVGSDPSAIYGSLQADGTVFLINPNGVLFAPGSQVDTGNLVASTAHVTDSFMNGFGDGVEAISLGLGEASTGKVINQGMLHAEGGIVALHAKEIENSGNIAVGKGQAVLAAARDLTLSVDTAGKLNFVADGELLAGKVLNSGAINAQGGYVLLTAKSAGDMLSNVVNHTGLIEAQSLSVNEQGEILLDGGGQGTVSVSGILDASGLADGQSGGTVRVLGQLTDIQDGAVLTANGDVDGGLVETSGDILNISTSAVIAAAGRKGKPGEWLLDPLEVIIASERPESHGDETPAGNTAVGPSQVVTSSTTETGEKYSFIDADYISWRLSNGTSVTVQAQDNHEADIDPKIYAQHIASIFVNSPITKSVANEAGVGYTKYGSAQNEATLTLEAQRNIAINAPITAADGKLNINLHADTDNDKKGMVIVNADIITNGGDFTAGAGATMETGNVGTYFGHANDEKDAQGNYPEHGDRKIITSGGSAKLYGDIALGLNKGSLVIDTTNGSEGGDIHVGANIDSVNAYRLFVNPYVGVTLQNAVKNDPAMKELARIYYDAYLKETVWKSFENLTEAEFIAIGMRAFSENKNYKDWNFKTQAERESILQNYFATDKNVLKDYYNGNVKITGLSGATPFEQLTAEQYTQLAKHVLTNWGYDKTTNRESILTRWELAELAAKEGTAGGSAIGDKYLATITTGVEDWVVSSLLAGNQYEALIGGRTAAVPKNVKAGREFYWMTGPEGEANDGQGTLFFTTTGNATGTVPANMYQGWSHDANHGMVYNEPNNDCEYGQSYVAVAWKADTSWADVHNSNTRVIGFIQETNTEHSGLQLNAGAGNVNVGGNIGKSVPLQALDVKTEGAFTVGGGVNQSAGTNFTGQVNADGHIDIIAETVNIGDTVTSTSDVININKPVVPSENVADSYRFQYNGVYEKPDFAPVEVTMYDGSGVYTGTPVNNNLNSNGSGSYHADGGTVEKVLGMATMEMPFFKEVQGNLSSYGVYAVTTDPDKVELESTLKQAVMPQVRDDSQYREYTKTLKMVRGEAKFVVTYNGSLVGLYPADENAKQFLEAGDGEHNVDVAAQALYTALADLGLALEDVDGLCVHFDQKH